MFHGLFVLSHIHTHTRTQQNDGKLVLKSVLTFRITFGLGWLTCGQSSARYWLTSGVTTLSSGHCGELLDV